MKVFNETNGNLRFYSVCFHPLCNYQHNSVSSGSQHSALLLVNFTVQKISANPAHGFLFLKCQTNYRLHATPLQNIMTPIICPPPLHDPLEVKGHVLPDSPHGFQWEPEPYVSHDGDDAAAACEDGPSTDACVGIACVSSVVSAAWPRPFTSASRPGAVSSQLCSPFAACTPAARSSATASQTPDPSPDPCTGSTFCSVFGEMLF